MKQRKRTCHEQRDATKSTDCFQNCTLESFWPQCRTGLRGGVGRESKFGGKDKENGGKYGGEFSSDGGGWGRVWGIMSKCYCFHPLYRLGH